MLREDSAMSLVFTTFLRSLDASGRPGSSTDFPSLWRALRRALRRELRRRGLWEASPRYLGVTGSESWYPIGALGGNGHGTGGWFPGDALDELATETYLRIFVARLGSLRHHLGQKPNIDGIVHRAIRQVIHDVQKRHDPLGYRVFKVSLAALRQLVKRGRLHPIDEAPRISNQTLFAFTADTTPRPISKELLEPRVRRFGDGLFPDLLFARGDEMQRVITQLAAKISGLEDDGVRAFTFRHLIDPLKAETRDRWSALLAASTGGLTVCDREPRCEERLPDDGLEARDRFEKLARCIEGRIDALGGQRRTREHRRKLWWFLHLFASASDERTGVLPPVFSSEELPSKRELSRLLDIPRGRLPELFGDLETVAETCLGSLHEGPEPWGDWSPTPLPPTVSGDGIAVGQALLERTERVWDAPTRPRPRVWWQRSRNPDPGVGGAVEKDRVEDGIEDEIEEGIEDGGARHVGEEVEGAAPRRTRRGAGPSTRPRHGPLARWKSLRTMVAGLAVLISVGVLALVAQRSLPGQRIEGAVTHLMLGGDRVTRGISSWPVLELSPGDRAVVVLISVPATPRPAHFELWPKALWPRRQDRGQKTIGEPLWRGSLEDRGQLEQALLLPVDRLEPGILRLELVDSDHREIIKTYTFEVRTTGGEGGVRE